MLTDMDSLDDSGVLEGQGRGSSQAGQGESTYTSASSISVVFHYWKGKIPSFMFQGITVFQ